MKYVCFGYYDKGGSASVLPSGIYWLSENRGHPQIKQDQIGLEELSHEKNYCV